MKRYLVVGISLVSLVLLACSAAPTPTPTSLEQYELWARARGTPDQAVIDIVKAWAIQNGTARGKAWVSQAKGEAIQKTGEMWEVELFQIGEERHSSRLSRLFLPETPTPPTPRKSDTFRYYPKTGVVAPIDAPHTFQ